MPTERRHALALLLAALDAVVLAVLWGVARPLRAAMVAAWPFDLWPGAESVLRPVDPGWALALTPVVVGVWLAVAGARGRYRRPLRGDTVHDAVTAGVALTVIVAVLFFAKAPHFSRTLLVGFAVASVPAAALVRRAVASAARRLGRPWRVAVVGPVPAMGAFERRVAAHPEWGVAVTAHLAPAAAAPRGALATRLAEAMAHAVVDEVRIVGLRPGDATVAEVADLCAEVGTAMSLDVDLWGVRPHGIEPGGRGLTLRFSPTGGPGATLKRAMDLVLGSGLLLAFAPLIALLWVAVRLSDGGPGLYGAPRVGRHGRVFTMWKLRSMHPGAHEEQAALAHRNEVSGPAFKLRDDPRVTRLGWWMRRASLDELPQLVHVVRGEMSLVGPRPPTAEEVSAYPRAARRRLSVRPGLTGLWQVSGRADLPYEAWIARDLEYLDRWSLRLDLWILWRTVPAVLSGRGAR